MNSEIALIAVLACHNRKVKTIASLRSFQAAAEHAQITRYRAILVDDGSTDGTGAAVSKEFPWVRVVTGSGSLYWCGGMRIALDRAHAESWPSHVLWLNDDTVLDPDALSLLLETAAGSGQTRSLVVGPVRDPQSGNTSYGGFRSRSPHFPLSLKLAEPGSCVDVDAMNGNVLLVPLEISRELEGLAPTYVHTIGDLDFGFRAKKAGVKLLLAGRSVGICARNVIQGTYFDPAVPVRTRLKQLMGPKGLPLPLWFRFTFDHGGWLWPLYFMKPYVNVLATSAVFRLRGVLGNGGVR